MPEQESDTPSTAQAIARLPRRSGFARAISRLVVIYRVRSRAKAPVAPIDYRGSADTTEGTLASPDVLRQTSELRLRFVGVYEYLGLFGFIPREGWLTEDGEIRVSARRDKGDAIERAMSSYYLSTTLDDGRVIVTFASPRPALSSSDRAEIIGGTGDLATDLARHREAVARVLRESEGVRPIVASSVDDCVALGIYHDRFATTDAELANILNLRLYGWGGIAAIVAAIVWAIVRRL